MKNIIAILLIFTSIGMFKILISPAWEEIGIKRSEQADFDKALNNTEELRKVRDELLTKYNSFSAEDRRKLEKLLPSSVDNVRLIIEIDKIASRHDILLKDVRVSQTQPQKPNDIYADASQGEQGPPYEKAPLSFSATGSYSAFLSFIRDLEHSLRIMDITGINVNSNQEGEYQYNIQLDTYWLKSMESPKIL